MLGLFPPAMDNFKSSYDIKINIFLEIAMIIIIAMSTMSWVRL
jgi:hypothetical protein